MSEGKKDHGWKNGDFYELLSYKSVCLIKYEDRVVCQKTGLCGMNKQECKDNGTE